MFWYLLSCNVSSLLGFCHEVEKSLSFFSRSGAALRFFFSQVEQCLGFTVRRWTNASFVIVVFFVNLAGNA